MPDKLMDFEEAKKYLDVSRSTLYNLASAKKIPAAKVGGQWRFRKERLIAWLDGQENLRKKPRHSKRRKK